MIYALFQEEKDFISFDIHIFIVMKDKRSSSGPIRFRTDSSTTTAKLGTYANELNDRKHPTQDSRSKDPRPKRMLPRTMHRTEHEPKISGESKQPRKIERIQRRTCSSSSSSSSSGSNSPVIVACNRSSISSALEMKEVRVKQDIVPAMMP